MPLRVLSLTGRTVTFDMCAADQVITDLRLQAEKSTDIITFEAYSLRVNGQRGRRTSASSDASTSCFWPMDYVTSPLISVSVTSSNSEAACNNIIYRVTFAFRRVP